MEQNNRDVEESFRDSVTTITKDGKRQFIYPKKPKGRYYRLRSVISLIYLIVFFSLPFFRVNGNPLFLFNILERKFILFGVVFWPQDFFKFGIGMLPFMVFIILFTAIFGRVFCGWACPQTIFRVIYRDLIESKLLGLRRIKNKQKEPDWSKAENKAKKVIGIIIWSFFQYNLAGLHHNG